MAAEVTLAAEAAAEAAADVNLIQQFPKIIDNNLKNILKIDLDSI